MLGPPKLRLLDQPVTVSLEELVPADHFYRHLDAKPDLSLVPPRVQDRCSPRRPAAAGFSPPPRARGRTSSRRTTSIASPMPSWTFPSSAPGCRTVMPPVAG